MSKTFLLAILSLVLLGEARAVRKPKLDGFYAQWGYNREVFSKSDIHFKKEGAYDFTLHNVVAKDKPDFTAFRDSPLDITIPQNSFRIGAYLNKTHTWAVELNFDHAKYVMQDDQTLRLTGTINDQQFDKDTLVRYGFVHLEHTDGANLYHINYVHQNFLIQGNHHPILSYLLKAGAGVVIPRTEISLFGKKLNNRYHISGYCISAEAGMRVYPLRNLFLELNVKGGFANYLNALAVEGGKVNHHFWYAEAIGLVGYDINWPHKFARNKR